MPRKKEKLQCLTGSLNVYKAKLNETKQAESKSRKETTRVQKAFSTLKKVITKMGRALSGAFKSGAVNLIRRIGDHAKKSSSEMSGLSKSFNMIKQALSGMLIYQGLSKIFDAAKEGMQNLAQVSSPTNKSLSMLMSALTKLKNTFATAFAPVLNFVAPALTALINLLTAAVDKIAQFFSALTGQSTYTKAVEVQQDYADSIADTTTETTANTKATEQNQKSLAGYDELNVMQKDNDTSEASTLGADSKDIAPSDMFTTAAISDGISGFAHQLKDLINKEDFEGVGTLIAKKINGALRHIDWASIRNTAKSWARNLAKFLNGAVSTLDWNLIGTSVGNGFMTLFDFAYTFLTTFNFENLGTGLADALNGIFSSVDWGTVGGTFGALVQSAISTGFGFVTAFNWVEAGLSLSDLVNSFFNEIDWVMAANTISTGIKGLFTTIQTFFENTDWQQIGDDIGVFFANIDWIGIFTGLADVIGSGINALLDLLLGMLKGFGLVDWFKDNLGYDLTVVFDALKKTFGGLIDFITGVFSGDWEKAWRGICDFFGGIWDGIWEIVKCDINLIIDGINLLWSGIYQAVKGIVDSVGGVAGAIGDVFGQDWHFSMPAEPPLIPKLATGTVIPANYGEFLATLGDNKREPEIVSPLSTMKQAFKEALQEIGSDYPDTNTPIILMLDGNVLFRSVINKNKEYKKQHGGKSAFI